MKRGVVILIIAILFFFYIDFEEPPVTTIDKVTVPEIDSGNEIVTPAPQIEQPSQGPQEFTPAPKELPSPNEEPTPLPQELSSGSETDLPLTEPKKEIEQEKELNTVYVQIRRFSFEPAMVEVPVNTTVIWNNSDTVVHIFKERGGTVITPVLNPGSTFEHTFTKPKHFEYTEFNYGARGTVIIK